MWSRRRVLAASGGLAAAIAAGSAGAWSAAARRTSAVVDMPSPGDPRVPPFDSADAARRAGWTVVTDAGAVGDGRSRTLGTRYPTLAAARRDFPDATDLGAELDGVAIQAAIDSGADRIFYPPGRYLHDTALVVRSGQRHLGAGPGTVLVNVRRRDTALDDALAHSFRIGNVHPVAMVPGDPEQSWAVRTLAPITAGSRTVVVTGPVAPASVAPGDVVAIRTDEPPVTTGNGVIHAFQMWNRVTAWDPGSGTLTLELPVPRDVVAESGDPTVLAGPRLCLNAGYDRFLGQPWSVVEDVEIGHLALDSAGLSGRNGVWRGRFHDLVLDAEHMLIFNALVESVVERVTGTWSARMIELKQASHGSTLRDVRGTHRRVDGVTPLPAISVGEQSFDCTLDGVDCTIGPDCRAPVRALEVSCSDLRVRGTLRHRGNPAAGQVWAVKSNDSPANPPTGVDLDLVVRAGAGFDTYGIVGNETDRPSFPAGVALRLDQRSDGTPPRAALLVVGGSGLAATTVDGDATCAVARPGVAVPDGMVACP